MRPLKRECVLPSAVLIASLLGCGSGHPASIQVADESARACDVLVDVGESASSQVDFGDGVLGASSQKGPRLGISWAASADRPFAPLAVTLRGATAPKLLTSACYDSGRRPIANPKVTLR